MRNWSRYTNAVRFGCGLVMWSLTSVRISVPSFVWPLGPEGPSRAAVEAMCGQAFDQSR